MPTRVVIVSGVSPAMPGASRVPPALFPRWGYLDKYAVNEYMARAFALTMTMFLAASAAWELLPLGRRLPSSSPVVRPERVLIESAYPLPPPSLVESGRVIPTGGGGLRVRARHFIPVPVPGLDADVVPSGGRPGTGPSSEGAVEPASIPVDAEIVLPSTAVWPAPEDIVVVEREPQLIAMQPPAYPEIAREAGVEGTVLVRVLVDNQGTVRDCILLQSVLGLDEAALAAAGTAVFRPALQQDKPVAVWVVLPLSFRLRG